MDPNTRRKAERVEVGFTVSVRTRGGCAEAVVRDLSRSGIRLRVHAGDLGFGPTADLMEAEEGVRGALADPFPITLEYERLGPLLQNFAHVRRIGLPADSPDAIELCCEFARPLCDEESHILAVPLPPLREDVDVWAETAATSEQEAGPDAEELVPALPQDAAVPVPAGPEEAEGSQAVPANEETPAPADAPYADPAPRHRFRALVSGLSTKAPPAIFCHSDLVTAVGVRVRVPLIEVVQAGVRLETSADALHGFVRRYGHEVELRLFDGDEEAFAGTVRVAGVQMPIEPGGDLLLSLGYDRRLKLSEQRRLGLLLTAA